MPVFGSVTAWALLVVPIPCESNVRLVGVTVALYVSVPAATPMPSRETIWLSRFPGARPESFLFPSHEVQMLKGAKETKIVNADLSKPVQS